MVRIKNIDGVNLIITVKLGKKYLKIFGDRKFGKSIKII